MIKAAAEGRIRNSSFFAIAVFPLTQSYARWPSHPIGNSRRLLADGELDQAVIGILDMRPHGRAGRLRGAPLQRLDQELMFAGGLGGDLAVKAQPENMHMGVQPAESLGD